MDNDMQFAFADARRGLPDCRPTPVCDPRPVCPACGGLECLCRPRFFAGQLLTDEDLNRLDYYIVAKNRLHNRHLFGSGVVCGLEVVCSSCDPAGGGTVIVRPGYALSPCGNDIVVCKETPVNVCELINKCRPRVPDDCMQPGVTPEQCQDDEDWVLAICYQERQSRGITSLRGASCSCGMCGASTGGSGCGCGGASTTSSTSSSASCGCDGASARTAKTQSAAKAGPVPPQCEPTLVCEGYTFAVYKTPTTNERQQDYGALVNRFFCCLQPLLEQLVTLPADETTPTQRQAWLTDLISNVREFLSNEGLYDCELARRLEQVAIPATSLTTEEFLRLWTSATLSIFTIVATVFQKCLCAALLPPCPPTEMNDCVPIATVNVSRGQCRVRHVCNLAERNFVLTFPTIEYWLSWLPVLSPWKQRSSAVFAVGNGRSPTLREQIAALCCTPITEHEQRDGVNLRAQEVNRERAARSQTAEESLDTSTHPFTRLVMEAFGGHAPTANAASLVLGAFGATAPDGSPLVSQTAVQNPVAAMLLHGVLAPALEPLLRGLGTSPETKSDSKPANELVKRVNELETQLEDLKTIIDNLSNPA